MNIHVHPIDFPHPFYTHEASTEEHHAYGTSETDAREKLISLLEELEHEHRTVERMDGAQSFKE